jgi:integrase
MVQKLTDRLLDTLPLPATGNTRIPDSEVKGFNAQVTAAGERGFVLRYRIRGRERLYTIGSRRSWGTVAARNRARELRRLIDQGIDPHEQKARERDEAITVSDFWTRVYEPLHLPTLRPGPRRNLVSMMTRDILPKLGRLAVKDVDRADVVALHREISKRAPIRANRVKTVISGLMRYAESPHIVENGERIPALRPPGSNPARGVALNHEEPRQRFLTPAEIARLAAVLESREPIRRERSSVALVRFLLLTGARFSEAAHATWGQFDLDRGAWTKPSSHTKQRRTHTIPLSAPALALLQQLRGHNGTSSYLFPGPTGRPLVKIHHFWGSVTRQAGLKGVRIHDLRHSFASVLASGGASLVLIGQLLGHSQASTTARYSHLIDAVQREAVERAGAVITGKPPAEVVQLPKSARR